MSQDHLAPLLAALEVSPDSEPLRAHVVKELLRAKRWEQAEQVAMPLHSGKSAALAWFAMARAAHSRGDADQARSLYGQAIGKDPTLIDEGFEAELEGDASPLRVPAHEPRSDEPVEALPEPGRTTTFADIGGMEELKEKIRLSIIYPLQKPEIYAAYGKKIGGGLLLYGPPGCGKTHLARATAGELGAKFYLLSLNQVLNMWLGESEKALAELFNTARKNSPSVIFIDEVDALGGKRSDMQSASRAIVSQFLTEMDGIGSENAKVMVLGATNMPWNVDSALRRPGRFDRTLFVPPPDRTAREQILQIHCKGRKLAAGLNLGELAKNTENFSGADLMHLVETATEQALAEALRTGSLRDVTQRDFQVALKDIKSSTLEWLRRAKNYVNFANQDGTYDELARFLEKARI
jgi:transitional endoplasmic reticulum ATPase